MVEAAKRTLLSRGARLWANAALAGLFFDAPLLDRTRPTIIASNHTSVLDSIVAINVMSALGRRWHVQAADQMIERFAWIYSGVYLPVGTNPSATAREMTRTRRMLSSDASRILWTYPQGDHFRASSDLETHRGPVRLTSARTDFWSAWISYEVFRSTRPVAAVGFHHVGVGRIDKASMDDGLLQARRVAENLMTQRVADVRKTFGD